MSRTISALACVLLAGAISAQQGKFTGFAVDAQAVVKAATGIDYDGMFGVAVDAKGHYYVTASRDPAHFDNSRMLFELDTGGRFVAGYPQPPETRESSWGIRDLAFDGDRFLYGGVEGVDRTDAKLFAFDVETKTWNPARSIVLRSWPHAVRGLAFNPNGSDSAGSFFVVDMASEIAEFDMHGRQIKELASVTERASGLGYDSSPYGDSLWIWSQSGSLTAPSKPGCRQLGIQVDPETGLETGMQLVGDCVYEGLAGGAEIMTHAGGVCLLVLAQGESDGFYEIGARFRYGGGCGPEIGYHGGTPYSGNADFTVTGSRFHPMDSRFAALVAGLNDIAQPAIPGITACSLETSPILMTLGPLPVNPLTNIVEFPIPVPTLFDSFTLHMQIVDLVELPLRLSTGGAIMVGR